MATAIHVGDIHSAIRANQTVARLRDQHAFSATNDALGLPNRHFRDPGINSETLSPAAGTGRRTNGSKLHQLSLSLGDDLVFDHQDVTFFEPEFRSLDSVSQLVYEGVTGLDFAREGYGDHA